VLILKWYRTIATPNGYLDILKSAFPEKDAFPKFLFAVPDYMSFLHDSIDPHLADFAKKENTKLQFHFMKTTDERYPFGAKFQYRAFCKTKTMMILKTELIPEHLRNECCKQLKLQAVSCTTLDEPVNPFTRELSAYHVLKSLPSEPIVPMPLVQGSRALLEGVMNGILTRTDDYKTAHYQAWVNWAKEEAPQDDDVLPFFKAHPPEYPNSFDKLFYNPGSGSVEESSCPIIKLKRHERVVDGDFLEIITTDSLRTSEHRTWTAPFIWVATGLPVHPRKTRKRKSTAAKLDDDDLLEERDFKLMTVKDLKETICKINDKYGLAVSTTGNKERLIKAIETAIELGIILNGDDGDARSEDLDRDDGRSDSAEDFDDNDCAIDDE
jgi:hypothetical protein